MTTRNTNRKLPIFATGCLVILILGVFIVCGFVILLNMLDLETLIKPVYRAEVNIQDLFIRDREKEFHLSRVIPKYDEVIAGIEKYYQDHGSYPEELDILVPTYLTQEPGIYLRSGEYLTYEPHPWRENTPSFTFSISGHYPFLAFMHGWELIYCPSTYLGCAAGGDRHIRVYRVNDWWIWIHSSAL